MTVNVRAPRPPGAPGIIDRLGPQPRIDWFRRADRLESWKEIAAYLNRSERTVRRWEEKEGLPVHRLQHDKRGSIFAYGSELDAWRESRQQLIALDPAEPATTPAVPVRRTTPRVAAAVVAVLVAANIGYALLGRRDPGPAEGTSNPEALRAFKQAQYSGNAGRLQVESGIRHYQDAIRLDPKYAAAWSGLASAHVAQTWFGDLPAKETMALAKREAQRAIELNPSISAAQRVFANVSHFLDWDHATAEKHFRRAIELDPRSSVAQSWYAEFLLDVRRFDEALAAARRAHDLNPRWLEPMTVTGNIHAFMGHIDLAIEEYRRALAIEPSFGLANHFLGRAHLAKGRHQEAIEQLRKSNELLGRVPFSIGSLGYALAAGGERAEAERLLADLVRRRQEGYVPAFAIAEIHMGLGHADLALEWLERASDERNLGYYLPSVDPIYEPIRAHARFQALMRQINLAQ